MEKTKKYPYGGFIHARRNGATHSNAAATWAANYSESIGNLYKLCMEVFPTDEGWQSHAVGSVAIEHSVERGDPKQRNWSET